MAEVNEINLNTTKRNQLIEITQNVGQFVSQSGVAEGVCVIYVPHTTAGLIINENADPDVQKDLLSALDAMVPKIKFAHSEGNSDAHLKSTIVGKEKTIIISKGKLLLGTWDGIYFAEFDGPRNRKIYVKIFNF